MIHLTFFHVVIAFLGFLIHVLSQVSSVWVKNKRWALGYFLNQNWLNMLISLIMIAVVLMCADELFLYGFKFTKPFCALLGYASNDIFYRFIKILKALYGKKQTV